MAADKVVDRRPHLWPHDRGTGVQVQRHFPPPHTFTWQLVEYDPVSGLAQWQLMPANSANS